MAWFDLPRAIRESLLGDAQLVASVAQRVHYQEIPQHSDLPHVWFSRTGRTSEDCLDGSDELTIERFSVEIVAESDAEAMVDRVVELLEAFRGTVTTHYVQRVDIEDADDDYVFRSVGEAEPDYLHALQVTAYVLPA